MQSERPQAPGRSFRSALKVAMVLARTFFPRSKIPRCAIANCAPWNLRAASSFIRPWIMLNACGQMASTDSHGRNSHPGLDAQRRPFGAATAVGTDRSTRQPRGGCKWATGPRWTCHFLRRLRGIVSCVTSGESEGHSYGVCLGRSGSSKCFPACERFSQIQKLDRPRRQHQLL